MAENHKYHSGIRDNHSRGKVAEFLTDKITSGSRLSVVSAYFTIYAYETLSKELDQIERLSFLLVNHGSLPLLILKKRTRSRSG
ncbi:hypothetical protein GLGCALEP_00321 [Pseudomonas sp. MM221]|nr:hypothetical protein GLGCALEP_00321 [Pseudomonas sp. MM221]